MARIRIRIRIRKMMMAMTMLLMMMGMMMMGIHHVGAKTVPTSVMQKRSNTAQAAAPTPPSSSSSSSSSSCSIYMAKSSIPNAGWGVFAARDFAMGDRIGTPSVGIPFLDMPTGRGDTTFIYGALSEYLWESTDIGSFGEGLRVDLFLPGPASLINHHAALDNVLPGGLTQDGDFYRYTSPMAGSSTAYHDFYLIAKRNIQKGEELFFDRTRNNNNNPNNNNIYYERHLPSAKDYELVDTMIHGIIMMMNNLDDNSNNNDSNSNNSNSIAHTLTDAQLEDALYRLAKEVVVVGRGTGYPAAEDDRAKRLLSSLIPRTRQELEKCVQVGTAKCKLKERSLDWIEQNGYCLDTITSKASTMIPEAGHGAFATRDMPKGSIISVSPMVTITNGKTAMEVPFTTSANTPPKPKDVLFANHDDDDNDEQDFYFPDIRANATQQLLTNYCFGHEHSDLLFCPTTHAALINHASTAATGTNSVNTNSITPNVAIRWSSATPTTSTEEDAPDHHFKLESLESITNISQTDLASYKTRVVMEYVAIRPIQAGEELFLDYTKSWEDALADHLEHGTSSSINTINADNDSRLSANKVNAMGRAIAPSTEVRHEHLAYFCMVYPHVKIVPSRPAGWEDFAANWATDREQWPATYVAWYKYNDAVSLYPCNVVRVDPSTNLHEVEMLVKPISLAQVGRKFRNVPGDRIQFTNSLYHTDMHLEWAFRHFIPIPDSIFPRRWRRDYKTAQDFKLGTYADVSVHNNAEQEGYERSLRKAKCGVYIAKSNIPNAGLGVYTAVDIPAGDVMVATSLSLIPAFSSPEDKEPWVGQDYVWNGFNASVYEGWPKLPSITFLAGVMGAMANCHSGINNLEIDVGEWSPALDGVQDYGAGAFSDYVNSGFRSKYPIAAGEELFVSYGETWFRHRAKFANVPQLENFMQANAILASVLALLHTGAIEKDESFVANFLSLIRDHFVETENKRTLSALSAVQTLDDLRHVLTRNGTAEATVEARSQEWLEANGYCQDHIFVKDSTLPNAGKGAFSRRFLGKGASIISAPTIPTTRGVLFINSTRLGEATNDYQLMTNYHFGHKDSSTLLFPLNQAMSINHNSARLEDGSAPNARITFSKTDRRTRYFTSLPLEDLLEQKYSTVMIEVIATRDIQPDEEIFIDYGEAWEEAWKAYIDNWKSPCRSSSEPSCFKSSKRVLSMNDDKFNKGFHPWTSTHLTTCLYNATLIKEKGETFWIEETISTDFTKAVVDPRRKQSYMGITYGDEGFKVPTDFMDSKPCKILDSSAESQAFDVVYFLGAPTTSRSRAKNDSSSRMVARVKDVPPEAIQFYLRPFQSDMMVAGTFRHEIAFPEEEFPPLWKDLLYL